MKLRKHKNNKSFLITFISRPAGVFRPANHVWATGSCKQSVMRAFLTGRDAGNLTTIIREAKQLV